MQKLLAAILTPLIKSALVAFGKWAIDFVGEKLYSRKVDNALDSDDPHGVASVVNELE